MTGLVALGVVFSALSGGLRVIFDHPAENLPGLLTALLLGSIGPATVEISIRRAWKKDERTRSPIHGVVSPSGIHYTSGVVDCLIPWSSCKRHRRKGSLVVIFTDSNELLWLSQRFFATPEEGREAYQRIANKVPPR